MSKISEKLATLGLFLFGIGTSYFLSETILHYYEEMLVDSAMNRLGTSKFAGDFPFNPMHRKGETARLVYELTPGREDTNSHGFRGPEVTLSKPPRVVRVAALGDSVTYGWNMTENYSRILEKKLNSRSADGTRFEVLNFGVGGYNVEQEVESFLVKAVRFNPDVVTVGWVSNDEDIGADAGLYRHFVRTSSRTYDIFHLQWLRLGQMIQSESLSLRQFRVLSSATKERGIPVVLAIFPLLKQPSSQEIALYDRIEREAKSVGFTVVNLFEPFQKRGFDKLKWDEHDLIHPNELGHKIAAVKIHQAIESLLPPTGRLAKK